MPNKFGSQNMGGVSNAFNQMQGRAAPQRAQGGAGSKANRPQPAGRGIAGMVGNAINQVKQPPTGPTASMPPVPFGGATTQPVMGGGVPGSTGGAYGKPVGPTGPQLSMPPATTNPVGPQQIAISDPARGQAQTQFRQLQAPLQKPTVPTGPSTSMPPVGGATTQPVKQFPGSRPTTPPTRRGPGGGRNQGMANMLRGRRGPGGGRRGGRA